MGIPAPDVTPGNAGEVVEEITGETPEEITGETPEEITGEIAGEADSEDGPQPEIQAVRKDWLDAAEPLTTIVSWLWDNAAAGILLVGAFLVVKGFVLSKGDISIALSILQNAGLSTAVVGGLLSGLPILAAAMLATTIYHGITRGSGNLRQNLARPTLPGLYLRVSPLTVVMLVAAVLCAVLTQWTVMVAAVVTGLVIGVIQCTSKKWLRSAAYLAAVLIGIVAVIAMLYTVWLPHEEMMITGVKKPVVGYVLADDPDGWISILLSGQHGIVWYRDAAVITRQPCERAPSNFWSQLTDAATLWQEITKAPGLTSFHPAPEPVCPS
jgi:hypothetical protein